MPTRAAARRPSTCGATVWNRRVGRTPATSPLLLRHRAQAEVAFEGVVGLAAEGGNRLDLQGSVTRRILLQVFVAVRTCESRGRRCGSRVRRCGNACPHGRGCDNERRAMAYGAP